MRHNRHEQQSTEARRDGADRSELPADAPGREGAEDRPDSADAATGSVLSTHHSTESRLNKARLALRMVTLNLPHLTRLAQAAELQIDARVETAAVTPSGRVLFNPKFLDSLTMPEATFVTAHELYHLVLQTHKRGEEADSLLVNIAHDLIINDILEADLGMTPPAGALRCCGARHVSLERLVVRLREKQNQNRLPHRSWRTGTAEPVPQSEMEHALKDAVAAAESAANNQGPAEQPLAGGLGPAPTRNSTPSMKPRTNHGQRDALTQSQELALFPLDDPDEVAKRTAVLLEVCIQSVALNSLQHGWERDDHPPRSSSDSERATAEVSVLQQAYRTPWERVVQQWLDAHIPQPRSYARPSRRAGNRTDVVLPGRRRDSTIIHVVLDTSGSMWPQLPAALGALASCCDATGVDTVRILQSDSDVTVDEVVSIDELRRYRVKGFSGREGYFVREQLKPPPPPKPKPQPRPAPRAKPRHTPEPPAEPPARRRRNKVVSRRKAKLSVPVNHRKRRRIKIRRGDYFRVRVRERPDLSQPQDLSLPLNDESPLLSMPVEPDSNMAPAMRRLAEDAGVESVLILTDGEIEYPAEPMPYDVLWVLVPDRYGGWPEFEPDNGTVVRLDTSLHSD